MARTTRGGTLRLGHQPFCLKWTRAVTKRERRPFKEVESPTGQRNEKREGKKRKKKEKKKVKRTKAIEKEEQEEEEEKSEGRDLVS